MARRRKPKAAPPGPAPIPAAPAPEAGYPIELLREHLTLMQASAESARDWLLDAAKHVPMGCESAEGVLFALGDLRSILLTLEDAVGSVPDEAQTAAGGAP